MWKIQTKIKNAILCYKNSYTLINPKIYHTPYDYHHDQKAKFYPIIGFRDRRSATLLMNKPNYNNRLSVECLDQMYRFFRSYDLDGSVNHIWLENIGKNSFSQGIQFNDLINNEDYLHRLFNLTIMLSKINKPVLGYIKGNVGSTAGNLLKLLSSPFGDPNINLTFNDINHGWIPTCGGSYNFSRYKGELGLYLALTGQQINAQQMVDLGYVYAILKTTKSSRELQKQAARHSSRVQVEFPYSMLLSQDSFYHTNQKYMTNRVQYERFIEQERIHILNKPNRKNRLIQSYYKQKIVRRENYKNHFSAFSEINKYPLHDYFYYKECQLLNHFEKHHLFPHGGQDTGRFPIHTIDKFFQYDSIQKIFEALEKDESEWAKITLDKLKQKNPLALKLTFRLIRQGMNSSYQQCLQRQYRVASRLRRQQEFIEYLSTKTNSRTIYDINQKQIDEYFTIKDEKDQLQHDLQKYCLLPVKQYKDLLPDTVRHYLNRQFFADFNQPNLEHQVQDWLRYAKINYKFTNWDLDKLRQKIYYFYELQRKANVYHQRIQKILHDKQYLQKFIAKRKETFNQMFKDEEKIKKKIKKSIQQLFRNRIKQRFMKLQQTADVVGRQKKIKMLETFKDTLVKKRLTITPNKFQQKQRFNGILSFDPNGQGIFQSKSSNIIQNSPLKIFKQQIQKGNTYNLDLTQQQAKQLQKPAFHVPQKVKVFLENEQGLNEHIIRYGYEANSEMKNHKLNFAFLKIGQENSQFIANLTQDVPPAQLQQKMYMEQGYKYIDWIKDLQKKFQTLPQQYFKVQVPDRQLSFQDFLQQNKKEESIEVTQDKILEFVIPKFKIQKDLIPQQLKNLFKPILQMIYVSTSENFLNWTHQISDKKINYIDDYLLKFIKEDYQLFVENDVKFIFSYFAIKKINQIVGTLPKRHIRTGQQLCKFLRTEYNINLQKSQVTPVFHNFVLKMITTYNACKQHIHFKNSKLLDKIIRNNMYTDHKSQKLTLETYLLTLGKQIQLLKARKQSPKPFGLDSDHHVQGMEKKIRSRRLKERIKTQNNAILTYDSYISTHNKKLMEGCTYYLQEFQRISYDMMGDQNFLPEHFRISQKLKQIPKYFDKFDQRKPYEQEIEQRFNSAIQNIFNSRYQVQRNLTKAQLLIFDSKFVEFLTPQSVKQMIFQEFQIEIFVLNEIKRNLRQHDDVLSEHKISKIQESDKKLKVKNRDALKRLNNLMTTISIEQNYNNQQDLEKNYKRTMKRLLHETFSQKQPIKFSEEQLIKLNFTKSEISQFTKNKIQRERNLMTTNLSQQLRSICQIKKQDQLFAALAKTI